MKEKAYLVEYYDGDIDVIDYRVIFITDSFATAHEYVEKFNRILHKWKEYYKKFQDEDGCWIGNEESEKFFKRWLTIRCTYEASYVEIEKR